MNVGIISLGCSKNLIDTEATIGILKKNNLKIVNDESKADMIIINTCGFIDSAKEEAINTILEMAQLKEKRCKYLVVMGCLVQRYYDDLIKLLPEVDLFIKIEDYDKLWEKIYALIKNGQTIQPIQLINSSSSISQQKEIEDDAKQIEKLSKTGHNMKTMPMLTQGQFLERTITTGKDFAYLKIGEGCSNRCTYCAIPNIRGPFVSRKQEDIIEEAKKLAKQGIKELIIIAQDTSKYGIDIYGENKLAELLQELSNIKEIHWIRFLYSYPEGITDKLIDVVANNKKIAKYFDIPIQHISNPVLKHMNRRTSKEKIELLLQNIRKKIPNVTLRTSLIVGFPGETEEQFQELLEFVKKVEFDKLGTFMYSKEEGTPAARLPEQIHGNTKKARYRKIMEAQQIISNKKLEEKIGNTFEVLVENITFDKKYYIGRTMQDVPEIDGIVYIQNSSDIQEDILHTFVKCEIIEVSDYDMIGKLKIDN